MIAYRQQFRGGKIFLRVVLNLFLTLSVPLVFLWSPTGVPAGFIFRSWQKLLRITIVLK
jgi:hypothetical protein